MGPLTHALCFCLIRSFCGSYFGNRCPTTPYKQPAVGFFVETLGGIAIKNCNLKLKFKFQHNPKEGEVHTAKGDVRFQLPSSEPCARDGPVEQQVPTIAQRIV